MNSNDTGGVSCDTNTQFDSTGSDTLSRLEGSDTVPQSEDGLITQRNFATEEPLHGSCLTNSMETKNQEIGSGGDSCISDQVRDFVEEPCPQNVTLVNAIGKEVCEFKVCDCDSAIIGTTDHSMGIKETNTAIYNDTISSGLSNEKVVVSRFEHIDQQSLNLVTGSTPATDSKDSGAGIKVLDSKTKHIDLDACTIPHDALDTDALISCHGELIDSKVLIPAVPENVKGDARVDVLSKSTNLINTINQHGNLDLNMTELLSDVPELNANEEGKECNLEKKQFQETASHHDGSSSYEVCSTTTILPRKCELVVNSPKCNVIEEVGPYNIITVSEKDDKNNTMEDGAGITVHEPFSRPSPSNQQFEHETSQENDQSGVCPSIKHSVDPECHEDSCRAASPIEMSEVPGLSLLVESNADVSLPEAHEKLFVHESVATKLPNFPDILPGEPPSDCVNDSAIPIVVVPNENEKLAQGHAEPNILVRKDVDDSNEKKDHQVKETKHIVLDETNKENEEALTLKRIKPTKPFKSPMQLQVPVKRTICTQKSPPKLKRKKELTREEIEALSEEEYTKLRINLLHDYNDVKDIGQMLLGLLAQKTGCTVKDMYEKFDLSLED